jgi:hypothetical protein
MLEAADQDKLELLAWQTKIILRSTESLQPGNRPTAARDGRNGWEVERAAQSAEDEV